MTDKKNIPARTASFVQVAQPNYDWTELEADTEESRVILPTTAKSNQATIVTPSQDTPAGRAVRAHELLHARYTPDVVATARKLANHGVSSVAINFAEDVRLAKIAESKNFYKTVDGHFDSEVIKGYLLNVARRHGRATPSAERTAHFTTGKAVQAAIGLLPYPLEVPEGFDRHSVESILGHIEVVLGGKATWDKVNLAKAQELFDEARTKIAEIEADTYRGSKATQAKFVDLANLVEDVLRRAYEDDIVPPGKGDGGDGDGDGKGEGEGKSGGGSGSSDGEGSEGSEPDATPDDDKDEAPEPKAAPRSSRADKPEFKPRGKSPLSDVLPPPPKIRRAGVNPINNKNPDLEQAVNDAHKRSLRDGEAAGRNQTAGQNDGKLVTNDILVADYSLDLKWPGWGEMQIKSAPLVRSKKNLVPRRGRAGIDGTLPRHFSRWFTDRHILDVRGRRPGGTLLIDGSGSMGWSLERTRKLIEICPALTVAIYSSKEGTNNREGVLTILARNGRACDPLFDYEREFHHGGGNVVDGPALEWLARQAGPRVWFSDGQVSGRGETFTMAGLFDAFRLAAAAQVTRTVSFEEVVAILSSKKPIRPVSPTFVSAIQAAQHERKISNFWAEELRNDLSVELQILRHRVGR